MTIFMGMQETDVSHSSTEAEVMSLDIGLRLEALFALKFWDIVIDALEFLASRARRDSFASFQTRNTESHTGIPATAQHQT